MIFSARESILMTLFLSTGGTNGVCVIDIHRQPLFEWAHEYYLDV